MQYYFDACCLFRYEGAKGLYKGMPVYLWHVTPNICIVLMIYEYVMNWKAWQREEKSLWNWTTTNRRGKHRVTVGSLQQCMMWTWYRTKVKQTPETTDRSDANSQNVSDINSRECNQVSIACRSCQLVATSNLQFVSFPCLGDGLALLIFSHVQSVSFLSGT